MRPAREILVAALAAAALLAVPSLADAKKPPKLKVSTAKRVTTKMARDLARSFNEDPLMDDGSLMTADSYSAGPCDRISRRRVTCQFNLYGNIFDVGGMVFPYDCWDHVRVKYAGRRGHHMKAAYNDDPQCSGDPEVGVARAHKRPKLAGVRRAIRSAER